MAPTDLNERERNKLTSTMKGTLLLNHKSWTAAECLQAHNSIWRISDYIKLNWINCFLSSEKDIYRNTFFRYKHLLHIEPFCKNKMNNTNTKQKFHDDQDAVHGAFSYTGKPWNWTHSWKHLLSNSSSQLLQSITDVGNLARRTIFLLYSGCSRLGLMWNMTQEAKSCIFEICSHPWRNHSTSEISYSRTW